MSWPRQVLILVAVTAASLSALTDPTPEELEQNRMRLQKWRARPGEYRRLVQAYRAFLALAPEKRAGLRQLDQDLYAEKPSVRARLMDAMERYADWLERLPEPQRRQIKDARDRNARLAVVRQLRQREWVARQALAVRRQLRRSTMMLTIQESTAGLMGPLPAAGPFLHVAAALVKKSRDMTVARLRERERAQHAEWKAAFSRWEELTKWRPPLTIATLKQSHPDVYTFLEEYLRPRLSKDDLQRLRDAADRPFAFPWILVELADKHPPALPGLFGPTHFGDLPKTVQKQLRPTMDRLETLGPNAGARLKKLKAFLKSAEGHWPIYGKAVAMLAKVGRSRLPFELWPSQEPDLSPAVRRFLKDRLYPELSQDEKKTLAEKKTWPEFPRTIDRLARQHKLRVPWLTLPGNRERWDVYRERLPPASAQLPILSRHTLRQLASLDLTEKERAELGVADGDPQSWELLRKEYFKRYPDELAKLNREEARKPGQKK